MNNTMTNEKIVEDFIDKNAVMLERSSYSEEQLEEVYNWLTQTLNKVREEEKERIAQKLNKALNKHSLLIAEGGLNYVKAFEEVEKLEHELFALTPTT